MNGKVWTGILGALVALFCAVTFAACSSPAPGAGTNTNWIKCGIDVDCANASAAATCVSGVCRTADGRAAMAASKLPSCTWPSTFDADASSRATCHPSRAYIACTNPGGTDESCTTNGAITCQGATSGTCHNDCTANEYAAACGGIGPGPVPDPPAGCRSLGANPGGVAFYCCPCGS